MSFDFCFLSSSSKNSLCLILASFALACSSAVFCASNLSFLICSCINLVLSIEGCGGSV